MTRVPCLGYIEEATLVDIDQNQIIYVLFWSVHNHIRAASEF